MKPERKWDTGTIRPYRPCPHDFRETFLELGQSKAIEEHYRTNWRVIIRWINESGGDSLRAERCKLSNGKGTLRPERRSKRYMMGRTLTAVTSGKARG